ncbi:unnamed protein product, partial [Rotaria magnacalcarata]
MATKVLTFSTSSWKLTKPESEGSVNVTTDPDLGEGKFGFLKFDYTDQAANGNRLSQ